jgi:hypothetical protein
MVLDESSDFFSTFYHCEREEWLRWDHELDKFNILGNTNDNNQDDDYSPSNRLANQKEAEIEFSQILIPTEDTIRYSYILNTLA